MSRRLPHPWAATQPCRQVLAEPGSGNRTEQHTKNDGLAGGVVKARALLGFSNFEGAKSLDIAVRVAGNREPRQIVMTIIGFAEFHARRHSQEISYRGLPVWTAGKLRLVFGNRVVQRADFSFGKRDPDGEADNGFRHRVRDKAVRSVAIVLITLDQNFAVLDQQRPGDALQ